MKMRRAIRDDFDNNRRTGSGNFSCSFGIFTGSGDFARASFPNNQRPARRGAKSNSVSESFRA